MFVAYEIFDEFLDVYTLVCDTDGDIYSDLIVGSDEYALLNMFIALSGKIIIPVLPLSMVNNRLYCGNVQLFSELVHHWKYVIGALPLGDNIFLYVLEVNYYNAFVFIRDGEVLGSYCKSCTGLASIVVARFLMSGFLDGFDETLWYDSVLL